MNCILEKVHNSFGTGIRIHVSSYPETTFYGYTLREALFRYREENNLHGKHLQYIWI